MKHAPLLTFNAATVRSASGIARTFALAEYAVTEDGDFCGIQRGEIAFPLTLNPPCGTPTVVYQGPEDVPLTSARCACGAALLIWEADEPPERTT